VRTTTVDIVDTAHTSATFFRAIMHKGHRSFSRLKGYDFDIQAVLGTCGFVEIAFERSLSEEDQSVQRQRRPIR
jgi:hypothetical protein